MFPEEHKLEKSIKEREVGARFYPKEAGPPAREKTSLEWNLRPDVEPEN